MNLIELMAEATTRAYCLHATNRGVHVETPVAGDAVLAVMHEEWQDFLDVMACVLEAHMSMKAVGALMTAYANLWALKALERVSP